MNEVDATNAQALSDAGRWYREMLLIRRFEETAGELYRQGEIPGFLHLSVGQEASAVGVAGALRPDDRLTTSHRGHGHLLAKGVPPSLLMAELFGKSSGVCGGYAGSMHGMSVEHGVLGANGIVGAGLPIAVGSALEQRYHEAEGITAAFFGEGALTTGSAHESFILAGLLRPPVLFVCEYNGWVEFSEYQSVSPLVKVKVWAEHYGIAGYEVGHTDVREVRKEAEAAITSTRAGNATLLIVPVTRIGGHYEGDDQRYREDAPQDPLSDLRGQLNSGERQQIDGEVDDLISGAVAFAREAPWPVSEGSTSA